MIIFGKNLFEFYLKFGFFKLIFFLEFFIINKLNILLIYILMYINFGFLVIIINKYKL